jgi:uncharacterized protein Usg
LVAKVFSCAGAASLCHAAFLERESPVASDHEPERKTSLLQQIEAIVRIPDWRLTTAEILYHMPDNHGVLQTFIWQKLDRAPGFPELSRFLDFWRREIEGPLHSVRVASSALVRPAELRYANGQFSLN